MKVHQLIARLSDHDPEADVVIAGPSGWYPVRDADVRRVFEVEGGNTEGAPLFVTNAEGLAVRGSPVDIVTIE